MNRTDLKELLSDNPEGLSTHEVVDSFPQEWNRVQNELRRMRFDGEVQLEHPQYWNENPKWVIPDEE